MSAFKMLMHFIWFSLHTLKIYFLLEDILCCLEDFKFSDCLVLFKSWLDLELTVLLISTHFPQRW